MLRQLLSKRILITMVVISITLSASAIWQTTESYADSMPTTKLVVVGANPTEVNWEICTGYDEDSYSYVYEKYDLDNPVNREIDLNIFGDIYHGGRMWSLSQSDLQNCGKITKISLSKEDGTVLDSIEAADNNAGLQSSDFDAHFNENDPGFALYSLTPDLITPSMSEHDGYDLTGIAGYNNFCKRNPKGSYFEIVGTVGPEACRDDYNHVITIYFNGAEDAPVIPEEVQAVLDAIDAIDDPVTLDSEDTITAARNAYNALPEEDRALIDEGTLKILTDAEEALENLKAISNVVGSIDAIGKVTLEKEEAITTAQAAYDALTPEQQAQVTNYNVLLEARLSLSQLKLEAANDTISNLTTERDNAINDKNDLQKQLNQAEEDKQKAQDELKAVKDEIAASKLTVSRLKVTSKAKKFTVTWKKNAKADGYQVQYKLKSAKKFSTLKTLAKTKVVSKKLKKGKMYQFKVRTYKTVNGTKVYGKWSPIKTCKCK